MDTAYSDNYLDMTISATQVGRLGDSN